MRRTVRVAQWAKVGLAEWATHLSVPSWHPQHRKGRPTQPQRNTRCQLAASVLLQPWMHPPPCPQAS